MSITRTEKNIKFYSTLVYLELTVNSFQVLFFHKNKPPSEEQEQKEFAKHLVLQGTGYEEYVAAYEKDNQERYVISNTTLQNCLYIYILHMITSTG